MEPITLSAYYKANRRYIINNWKKSFIQEKYRYNFIKYVRLHIERMEKITVIDTDRRLIRDDLLRTITHHEERNT